MLRRRLLSAGVGRPSAAITALSSSQGPSPPCWRGACHHQKPRCCLSCTCFRLRLLILFSSASAGCCIASCPPGSPQLHDSVTTTPVFAAPLSMIGCCVLCWLCWPPPTFPHPPSGNHQRSCCQPPPALITNHQPLNHASLRTATTPSQIKIEGDEVTVTRAMTYQLNNSKDTCASFTVTTP